MRTHTRTIIALTLATLGLALVSFDLGAATGDEAITTAAERQTLYRGGPRTRDQEARGAVKALLQHAPLRTEGKRQAASATLAAGKTGPGQATVAGSINEDFWFYDAWVELYYDEDHDGYYTDIDLVFDADTVYSAAAVFAVAYLSYEGGPWNEYAVTDTFWIYEQSAEDEYLIETTLVSGYPRGDYDLLIELYDAYSGQLLADFGPDATDALAYLPLEDQGRDTPKTVVTVVHTEHGGGGSMGWLLLGALGLAAIGRRQR